MSVGPMSGIVTSAAGAPLSQTSGSETERAQKDANTVKRQADSETKSEKASGIGETEQDQSAGDRDADGRRLWESMDRNATPDEANTNGGQEPVKQAKDPSGNRGTSLDLTG